MTCGSDPGRTAARWSALHHGIDPAGVPLLRSWLRLMWQLARPLARCGVRPTAVTVVGALVAVAAAVVASSLPWLALVLVLVAVVCDGLDGAVAVLADRATRSGAVADAVADRVADVAFAVVLWRCGAPWGLAVAAGVLSTGHELVRWPLGRAARSTITVAERPTRTVCTALACGCAVVTSTRWPVTVCAGVWVGLAVIGVVQLALTTRRTAPST